MHSKVLSSSGDNAVATNCCVRIRDLGINRVYKRDYAWDAIDRENA